MKRFAVSTIATVMFTLAGAIPVAAAGATVDTFPVTFTITSAQCGNLPAGTTINGSGAETSITAVRTDASGVTTIENSTHAQGTATDNQGNTYVFNYANSFRVSNTVASPGRFSGNMTDAFSLAGNGPAQLHNGFSAGLTSSDGFATITWSSVTSRGDPISFGSGAVIAHCDPL